MCNYRKLHNFSCKGNDCSVFSTKFYVVNNATNRERNKSQVVGVYNQLQSLRYEKW